MYKEILTVDSDIALLPGDTESLTVLLPVVLLGDVDSFVGSIQSVLVVAPAKVDVVSLSHIVVEQLSDIDDASGPLCQGSGVDLVVIEDADLIGNRADGINHWLGCAGCDAVICGDSTASLLANDATALGLFGDDFVLEFDRVPALVGSDLGLALGPLKADLGTEDLLELSSGDLGALVGSLKLALGRTPLDVNVVDVLDVILNELHHIVNTSAGLNQVTGPNSTLFLHDSGIFERNLAMDADDTAGDGSSGGGGDGVLGKVLDVASVDGSVLGDFVLDSLEISGGVDIQGGDPAELSDIVKPDGLAGRTLDQDGLLVDKVDDLGGVGDQGKRTFLGEGPLLTTSIGLLGREDQGAVDINSQVQTGETVDDIGTLELPELKIDKGVALGRGETLLNSQLDRGTLGTALQQVGSRNRSNLASGNQVEPSVAGSNDALLGRGILNDFSGDGRGAEDNLLELFVELKVLRQLSLKEDNLGPDEPREGDFVDGPGDGDSALNENDLSIADVESKVRVLLRENVASLDRPLDRVLGESLDQADALLGLTLDGQSQTGALVDQVTVLESPELDVKKSMLVG